MDTKKILSHLPKGVKLTLLEKASSTNRLLTEKARAGAQEDELLIALSQSEGRGRFDRRFFSPDGTGVYMSLLLHPDFEPSLYPLITPLTGVAVAEAIEAVSNRRAGIKWVNDIYADGRKLCGILAEAGFAPAPYLVIGIGINVFPPKETPRELAHLLGTVLDEVTEDGRERLIGAFLDRFYAHLNALPSRAFLEEYRQRSILTGKWVYVHDTAFDTVKTGEGRKAECIGIDEDGALLVRYENGAYDKLIAGEVTLSLD